MASLDEIKQTFFIECEEQLEVLTDGLDTVAELDQDASSDPETINGMFRAVHSIKGGAASFSLDAITRFAHVFETVLDEMRDGRLVPTQEQIRQLYAASDYLADLVALGASGDEPDPDELARHIEAIGAVSVEASGAESEVDDAQDDCSAPADALDAFTPTPLDFGMDLIAVDDGPRIVEIRFVPSADLYVNGHEPLYLFRELETLGTLSVAAELADAPSWDTAAPGIIWTLQLETDRPEDDIREIFEFAEPFAEIQIDTPTEDEDTEPFAATDLALPLPVAEDAGPSVSEDPAPPAVDETPPPAAPAEKAKAASKTTVRVDLDLVDDLINTVGELVITQSVMGQSIDELGRRADTRLTSTMEELRALTRQIQEGVMAIRAQSVKPLFQRMARIVRETAQIAEKDVRFETVGEETEVDRTVIERLVDPLTHIVRNAIDHGLETAETREAVGKPQSGTVTLSAAHRSGRVIIEVRDDGGGINRDRVLASAIRKGLVPENADLSAGEIEHLIFMPGFSTASAVTNLSGRGVGMDVVNNEIRRLGGHVTIASELGQGTTISIGLPLTLAVLDGMIVDVAGQTMVVPLSSIIETVRPDASELKWVGRSSRMLAMQDAMIPIIDLGQVFGYSDTPALDRGGALILVENDRRERRALAVDRIRDQRQVVIKSLEANYGRVPCVAAATILGDGKIALIVDIAEISTQKANAVPKGKNKEVAEA